MAFAFLLLVPKLAFATASISSATGSVTVSTEVDSGSTPIDCIQFKSADFDLAGAERAPSVTAMDREKRNL